jgi:uncharacterized repeat protein (TIGR04076 family)
MGLRNGRRFAMAVNEQVLEMMKQTMGYSDEEWERWKAVPRNMQIAERMPDFMKYRVVVEVLSARGCAMMHKAGDKFYFNASGALLCKKGISNICAGALMPVLPFVWGVLDKIAMGQDPTQIAFNHVRCLDVGLDNGGWGEILMEVRVEKTE